MYPPRNGWLVRRQKRTQERMKEIENELERAEGKVCNPLFFALCSVSSPVVMNGGAMGMQQDITTRYSFAIE